MLKILAGILFATLFWLFIRDQAYRDMAISELRHSIYDDFTAAQAEKLMKSLVGPMENDANHEDVIVFTWNYLLKSQDTASIYIEVGKNPISITFIDPSVKGNKGWAFLLGNATSELGVQ